VKPCSFVDQLEEITFSVFIPLSRCWTQKRSSPVTVKDCKCARLYSPADDSHHSEWQESHKYHSDCDLQKLYIYILEVSFISIYLFPYL